MRASRTKRLLNSKIKSRQGLRKIVQRLKRSGRKVVFTNGCFDLLHYGHVKYLEQAKKKGDILVVGLNSDSSVKRLKGKLRPIIKQKHRMRLLAGLESVDFVVAFSQDTPLEIIKILRPDILVKGADWKPKDIVGGNFVRTYGGKVVTVEFIKGLSTTNLIKKIAQVSRK